MMETDNYELNTINEKDSSSTKKKTKQSKRRQRTSSPPPTTTITNGHLENGTNSIDDSQRSSSIAKSSDDKLTNSKISESKSFESPDHLDEPLTPIVSTQSTSIARDNPPKYTEVTLTTVQDDEDDDDDEERDERKNIQPVDRIIIDSNDKLNTTTTTAHSVTSGDNDIIEIHEFSLADLDAYLDIYFDTLNSRLQHYVGNDEERQQFRDELKTRISSNTNAREFHNVLLGKVHDDVVAAVTLSFPGETTTILDANMHSQSNSCLTSIYRRLIKNANYIPTNMTECYIEMIGVKSSCQKHGIGTAMLECVEHFARQAGANILTVHVNNEQLRTYFQRFGFQLDTTDMSAIWKWIVERQNINKMSKVLPPSDEIADNSSNHMNESVTGSELE